VTTDAATTADAPAAGSSSPSSEVQSDHINSMLCNLPAELTSEQKDTC